MSAVPEVKFIVEELPDLNDSSPDVVPIADETRVRADGKIECANCARYFSQNADGSVRGHKCSGTRSETATSVPRTKGGVPARRKGGRKVAPPQVRRIGVAVVATTAESGASFVVARAVGCEPREVPSKLPAPDDMVGPFLDQLWPSLPAKAQSVISSIAEQEELIGACFLWWEWWRNLKSWSEEQRSIREINTKTGATHDVPVYGFDERRENFGRDGGTITIPDGIETVYGAGTDS